MKVLLQEACIHDEVLFSSFLNRLFNTLSWSMTEFSVSIREMQESYQVYFLLFSGVWIYKLVHCNSDLLSNRSYGSLLSQFTCNPFLVLNFVVLSGSVSHCRSLETSACTIGIIVKSILHNEALLVPTSI